MAELLDYDKNPQEELRTKAVVLVEQAIIVIGVIVVLLFLLGMFVNAAFMIGRSLTDILSRVVLPFIFLSAPPYFVRQCRKVILKKDRSTVVGKGFFSKYLSYIFLAISLIALCFWIATTIEGKTNFTMLCILTGGYSFLLMFYMWYIREHNKLVV